MIYPIQFKYNLLQGRGFDQNACRKFKQKLCKINKISLAFDKSSFKNTPIGRKIDASFSSHMYMPLCAFFTLDGAFMKYQNLIKCTHRFRRV